MQRVVLGADIDALRYAFEHGLPLLYVDPKKPHHLSDDLCEWHHLYWCLSLAGKIIFANTVTSITVNLDSGSLKVIYNNRTRIFEGIDKFYIFDESKVAGLPASIKMSTDVVEVLDWINVRSGMRHEHDKIENPSQFMKTILFYPTLRIDGNHDLKDICVKSYLTDTEVSQFEHSELVVKIKTQEAMKEVGIRGAGNGVGKFLSIKLESDRRETSPLGHPVYSDLPENLIFRPEVQSSKSSDNYLNILMREVDFD
jgi:hypothetical protein